MKSAMLLSILVCCFVISCSAQKVLSTDSLKTIEQLSFMQGTWQGEGWMMINRERKEFTQNEVIDLRVDNSILVIDGIGYSKEKTEAERRVIHNAFGVISYNKEKNAMTIISFSSTGGNMENKLKSIGDKKLEWSFQDDKGGTIRFREDFTIAGYWTEKGDYSFDGEQWFPFFEMTLKRQ